VNDKGKASLVDESMISNGYSTFKSREDNTKYDARLKKAEKKAKDRDKGLWKTCGGGHVEVKPPTEVPKLGSGDNPAPIGTALEAGGQRYTLNSAYPTASYGYFAPQQNYIFLVVNMTIQNIDDPGKEHDYNELCFSAKDLDQDANFDDSFINPSDIPLGSGKTLPGDVVQGDVVLEVHQNSHRIRVKYDTGCGIGGTDLYWLVEI
jgi:hypothetical protein